MGLTTALYSGVSGLNANSQMIAVAGNNIANVNTVGFKSSRIDFQTQVSDTLAEGSAPSAELGGSNPMQVGLGTQVGAISRNFNDGSIQPTGVPTDMALEGPGFFVVNTGGSNKFTRAGNFKLDAEDNLVTVDGGFVQGYPITGSGETASVGASLGRLRIPLGSLTTADATRNVNFAGNFNSAGDPATQGAAIASDPIYADAAATNPATGATALTGLFAADGTPLFSAGDVVTISGATKGGATLADRTFEVGAANTTGSDANGTTLGDFLGFLNGVLGIDPAAGGGAGVTMNNGAIAIRGNPGTANDFTLARSDITVNAGTPSNSTPFTFNKAQTADGESVRTTFVAYDSLGEAVNLDLTAVLESKTDAGTQWRFYAQDRDGAGASRVVGSGTLTFDTDGQLIASDGTDVTIDRSDTGAANPQSIKLHFDDPPGSVSALASTTSQLGAPSQDGTPMGVLEDFTVDADGTIQGVFSNSQTRQLGRVAIATFTNPHGLVEAGGNLFATAPASGEPVIGTAAAGGNGRILGGALELSNVDLSQEFINLITASTGFSANSRVLTTSDRLMQDLLQTIR